MEIIWCRAGKAKASRTPWKQDMEILNNKKSLLDQNLEKSDNKYNPDTLLGEDWSH